MGVLGTARSAVGIVVKFITIAVRLVAFAVVLLPAFIRIAIWYLWPGNVIKSIQYGPNSRNYLDVYVPPEVQGDEAKKVGLNVDGVS